MHQSFWPRPSWAYPHTSLELPDVAQQWSSFYGGQIWCFDLFAKLRPDLTLVQIFSGSDAFPTAGVDGGRIYQSTAKAPGDRKLIHVSALQPYRQAGWCYPVQPYNRGARW